MPNVFLRLFGEGHCAWDGYVGCRRGMSSLFAALNLVHIMAKEAVWAESVEMVRGSEL